MTPVERIDDCWGWVKSGCEEVIRRTNADWSVADVYLALKHKQAALYTVGQDDGFVILQKLTDFAGPYLFIWVLWGRDLAPYRHKIMAEIRALAVSVGAKRMQMKSPRGWDKADLGWRLKEKVYEADIWTTD